MKKTSWLVLTIILSGLPTLSAQTLADGAVHTAKIDYEPGTLEVFIDDLNNPVLTLSVNLSGLTLGNAWIGFTSGTGDYAADTDVLSWSFSNGSQDFDFADFSSVGDISFAGSAAQAGSRLRVVHQVPPSGAAFQTGAAWHHTQRSLHEGFTSTFAFQITTVDPAADGLVFVIQRSSDAALGGCGKGLGYLDSDIAGGNCDFYGNPEMIPVGLGVEFDTFPNGLWPPEYIDGGELLGGVAIGGDGHVAVISTAFVIFADGFESGDTSAWSNSVP